MNCAKCSQIISDSKGLTCIVCAGDFHPQCVGMQIENFRKMAKDRKESWKCTECKGTNSDDMNKTIITGVKKDNDPMRQLFEEFTRKISKQIATINDGMGSTKKQCEEILTQLKEMKISMSKIEARQTKLEEENEMLKKSIEAMKADQEDRFDFLENRSRICNLEIRNVPETGGEDIIHLVQEIGRTIGIPSPIPEGDIQVAHRVDQRNKQRGSRPIIVHLASRYLRNKWLQQFRNFHKSGNKARLTARMINKNLPDTPVYINEHITVSKKLLLKEAKDLAKQHQIKYVWVKDAYILMKKSDTDQRVKKINTKRELEEFGKDLQTSFH